MADFDLEKVGRPKPLISLPRGPIRNEDGTELPPTVRIFVEFAKGVAGCCFCDAPIPKETTRFCLAVTLPATAVSRGGRRRTVEKYYAHSGCMGGLLGNEVKRNKHTCWDCGAPPPEGGEGFASNFHPYAVFTSSKFAAARLCSVCARKPKWRRCQGCHVHYPLWMVDEVVDDLESRWADMHNVAFAEVSDNDLILYPNNNGQPVVVCEHCAARANVRTRKVADAEKAEFEETRRRILEEGIFGED